MRVALMLAGSLVASQALAQDAGGQVSQTSPSAAAAPAGPSHAQLVADYPQELASRPRAIGAGLFEAGWDGSWQFSATQGFGEVPDVRYGISDQVEVTLLGVRYTLAEDARNIPGLALRAQLHDLAFQNTAGGQIVINGAPPTSNFYPILRPGVFAEFRDRLPFKLAVNGTIGYEFSVQTDRATNGAELPESQRISTSFAPMELEVQWSPLKLFSLSVLGGYIDDTTTSIFEGTTMSEGILTVALVLNTNRFDFRVFYTNNWFSDSTLGYVPEVGVGAAIRL